MTAQGCQGGDTPKVRAGTQCVSQEVRHLSSRNAKGLETPRRGMSWESMLPEGVSCGCLARSSTTLLPLNLHPHSPAVDH